MLVLLVSLILLTLGAAISYKNRAVSFIFSIVAVMILYYTGINAYTIIILVIAILNIISLLIISGNQISGVDFALVAVMCLATVYVFFAKDLATLLTLFVAVSVPTYLLVMISDQSTNVEIGIKYVTFMVIATILFLSGAALLYYHGENAGDLIYATSFLLLITGLCIEVGIAPVHEWVPDVFSTADPIPVSIIASLAKFVPFIVVYKILLSTAIPLIEELLLFTALVASVSMFAGNIGALTSKDPSRILAYSTVANMGYVLATFTAITAGKQYVYFAIAGGILQLAVNSFGKVGFFTTVKDNSTSSVVTWLLSFSLIGLPPLMGFWSKFFIIYSLVFSNYIWLAVILVLNSAISIPYYVRLARLLGKGWKLSLGNFVAFVSSLCMLITLIPPTWFVHSVTLMGGI